MMEGVAMGGSIGGPFGALGGLGLGLIYGLATADSHYERLNAQIQAEQAKDKELEAQLEREIERQRELEAQLGKSVEPVEKRAAGEIQRADKPAEKKAEPKAEEKKAEAVALASLSRKEPAPPASPFKNIEIRDSNGDGIPDLWIYYHPLKPGEIVRQEEDTDGDGRVDTWSYFNNGRLVRREADSRKAGSPDRVYHYDGEQIVREERDENGDGRMSFRAYYQNGRLARAERDLDRDGRMDLWIYYDTTKETEVVVKEERDLNGDGAVDLWSYYESGRLARRDVSATGLEILSKQEEIPVLPLSPQAPLPPGS
jgi:antitoxin component YwqK of YwqJK toxin-antitoxin module